MRILRLLLKLNIKRKRVSALKKRRYSFSF
nr:MAG TPA: hypothetical protein [Caudoviricetes sp.]